MRRFTSLLFFLVLANDAPAYYAPYIFSPFAWVRSVLLQPIAAVRPLDVLLIVILVYGRFIARSKTPEVRPLRRMLYVAAAVTLFELVYGIATGGDGRAAGWQVYLPISMILATFTFASIYRTADHFLGLWNVLLAAGVYHAFMAIIFYLEYVRPYRLWPVPQYLSTHEDTVVWTAGICLVTMRAIMTRTLRNRALAAAIVPLFIVAIQFNNRRLAWIALGGALLTLYFMLPPSAVKRRINRGVAILVPILLLYVAVGWGHSQGIFAPLKAFQTVSTAEDASTKARNVENLGLIATAHQGRIFGTGWGHKYIELSDKYQIHEFELWPYVPHNSILGLLAYTGYVGFLGYWMLFPAGAFFHARLGKAAQPVHRLVGFAGMAQIVACACQWYGDMGSFSLVTMYTLASSLAAAMRIPIVAEVWPPQAPAARVVRSAGAA